MRLHQFRNVIDEAYCHDPVHRFRWSKTMEFVRQSAFDRSTVTSGLDLGDRTPLTAGLEEWFGCHFSNTTIDLDTGVLEGSFDVVTAFEVLEHLYNPLHLLLEVRKVLHSGHCSRLFLSTPVFKPLCLQSSDHFHEMSRRALEALVARAGFRLVRSHEFRIRPLFFYLTGVKPLMRAIFEKIQIYELALQDG